MAMNGLFLGWGAPVPGREAKAVQEFQSLVEYLGGAQQRGEIEGFTSVFLEPHGGDLGGFVLIRGEQERLSRLRGEAEFLRLMTRAGLVVTNLGVVGAWADQAVAEQMGIYQQAVSDLA